jgi:hypothetical protein
MGCRMIREVLTAKCKEQDYTSFQEKAGKISADEQFKGKDLPAARAE